MYLECWPRVPSFGRYGGLVTQPIWTNAKFGGSLFVSPVHWRYVILPVEACTMMLCLKVTSAMANGQYEAGMFAVVRAHSTTLI